jgi:hypothetical protein
VKQAEPVVPEIPKAAEPVEERRVETASLATASDAPRAILPVMMISPLSAIPPQLLQPAKAAPAPRPPVKPKAATKAPKMQVAAKRQDKNRFVNPLPSPQKVAAAITGAVKGIEKIPTRIAALVKPQTSAH